MKTPFILETTCVLFNWGLLGAFLVQIYIYAVWYHHTDRGAIRYIGKLNKKDFVKMTTMNDIVSIVYVLFVVEGVQTGLMTHTAWEILAYNWGDPSILLNIPWSSATTPIIGGIVAMIVQFYFAWRIWILQKNIFSQVISIIAILLSMLQCICAIVYGGKFIGVKLNSNFLDAPDFKVLAIIWLAGNYIFLLLQKQTASQKLGPY
ncbi:transmembrane protein [Lentinula edodes]|uniref:Transmembrane protein n=1 Tax=Lentinula edodes TaxID=5353 RepID=A0A1Q3EPP6_LENED|nr:transmembrane protein [Lentinula edodes]